MLDYTEKIANLEAQAKALTVTHQQLTAQVSETATTLWRIQGAIQILRECQRELETPPSDGRDALA